MSEIVLNAEVRQQTGKRAKRVRTDGNIPGIFYARGEGNTLIQVPKLGLDPLIYTSETHVIDLRLSDGSSKNASSVMSSSTRSAIARCISTCRA